MSNDLTWAKLHARFIELSKKTGMEKSSSYSLDIHFYNDGEVGVHMGTYDIADWPRHTNLGPFKTEAEALAATQDKIEKAEWAVRDDLTPIDDVEPIRDSNG